MAGTRSLSNAKLLQDATIENVDYRTARGLRSLFQSLTTFQWIREHNHLVIVGPTGNGRSWLRARQQGLPRWLLGPLRPRRQIAPLPACVLALPLRCQSGHHRRRQVGGVLAQQGRQRLLEIAGRDAAQVKHRQERIQAPAPPRPQRDR